MLRFASIALALAACATVPAGHSAVVLTPDGVANEALGEGVHYIGLRSQVDLYDLRAQDHDEDLAAISADGAALEARASVLTYHIAPNELVALAREVGSDYYAAVVQPVVSATVRRVLAAYRADELDVPHIREAQEAITQIAAERLRHLHVVLDVVNLRTLALPASSGAYRAILQISVIEQEALAAPMRLDLARKRAVEQREAARGIASALAVVAPTLSPQVLLDQANRAWSALLTGKTTTVVVRDTRHPSMLEVSP